MKPRSVTFTPAASAPIESPLGRRPTATRIASKRSCRGSLSLGALPRSVTVSPSAAGLDLLHFGSDQDRFVAATDAALEHLDQIGVGAGHQSIEQLDHGHLGAQRVVDGGELEPDDAAADHQQPLRDLAQLERRGRVPHARIVVGDAGDAG